MKKKNNTLEIKMRRKHFQLRDKKMEHYLEIVYTNFLASKIIFHVVKKVLPNMLSTLSTESLHLQIN